jgi:hypothetical protein
VVVVADADEEGVDAVVGVPNQQLSEDDAPTGIDGATANGDRQDDTRQVLAGWAMGSGWECGGGSCADFVIQYFWDSVDGEWMTKSPFDESYVAVVSISTALLP